MHVLEHCHLFWCGEGPVSALKFLSQPTRDAACIESYLTSHKIVLVTFWHLMQKQLAHKRMIKNRVAAVVDLARWIHTPVACCRYCGTEAMDAFRHSLEGCVLISNVRNISEMPADVRCTSGFQTLVGSLVPCAATKKDYTPTIHDECIVGKISATHQESKRQHTITEHQTLCHPIDWQSLY